MGRGGEGRRGEETSGERREEQSRAEDRRGEQQTREKRAYFTPKQSGDTRKSRVRSKICWKKNKVAAKRASLFVTLFAQNRTKEVVVVLVVSSGSSNREHVSTREP